MPGQILMSHLDEPVAQHMRKDHSQLRASATVREAIEEMRAHPPGGRVVYLYAIDDEGALVGVVPTRRLLLSSPEAQIRDIMIDEVVAIPSRATLLDACEFFTLHRLLAFPIVDEKRRLLGILDVETYTDEMIDFEEKRNTDNLFQLIGVHLTEASQASARAAFASRFPWLLCNIAGGVLAAFLARVFEAELERAVALALFLPVVLALAESVAIQSVSLALQGLGTGSPSWTTIFARLRRESWVGGMLGLACGAIVGSVGLVWLGAVRVAVCVLVGITGGVAAAAIVGVGMPNVLRHLRLNPSFAAGPIALAVADMITLSIYFSMARAIV